jgi:hypothetical protein
LLTSDWRGVGKNIATGFSVAIEGLAIGAIIGKQLTTWLDGNGPPGAWAKFFHTDQAVAAQKAQADSAIDFARRAADAEDRVKQFAGTSHTSQNNRQAQDVLVKYLNPTLGPIAEEVKAANAYSSGRAGTGSFDPASFRAYMLQQGNDPGFIAGQVASVQRALEAANRAHVAERIFGKETSPISALLAQANKPMAPSTTNVTVYMTNTFYEFEDGQRVVSVIAKGLKDAGRRPAMSPSVGVYR